MSHGALSVLVVKLNSCVAQLEQFPIEVHDLPADMSGITDRGGASALKFLKTHKLKVRVIYRQLINNSASRFTSTDN